MSEQENVIPFRRQVPPAVWSDGRVQTECDTLVHLFGSVPGRCQCGERTWMGYEDDEQQPDRGPQIDQEEKLF